ncbi:MAG TPA: DUF881 domain-containing protein [Symbiobacteriaceae bacterium]
MLVFGLLLTTQFRVQKQIPLDPTRLRSDQLATELAVTQETLKAVQAERDRLAKELDELRKALAEQNATPPPDTTPLELLAGTVETRGPGVIVTVTEATDKATQTRVQDEDLWTVINELYAAGAEAIAVNGQRLTSISGIRNVGQRIMIYQTLTASPFEIAAIGDPAVLESALRMRGGVIETLDRYGIKVTVARSDQIILPAFRSIPEFRYAKKAE